MSEAVVPTVAGERLDPASSPPLVSIVITSYNYAHFIRTAIDSVLGQDYPNLEVVVTDNQSTDNTIEVLSAYDGDPRVRVNINPENVHITPNINIGVKLARGKYVVVLSADDYLLPGHLSRLVEVAESRPEVIFVYGNAYFAEPNGDPYGVRNVYGQVPGDYAGHRNEFATLLIVCYVCMPTILFRRSTFERFGFFDERIRIAQDWEMCLRLASRGEQFAYVSAPVVGVRMHEAQHSAMHYMHSGADLRETIDLLERYLVPETFALYHGYELRIRKSLIDRTERLTSGPNPENYTPELKERTERIMARLIEEHGVRKTPTKAPKISAIVVSNGRLPQLGSALRSLAAQTHTNWDAVVLQTTGFSLEPLVRMTFPESKVRYVRTTQDLRPAAARNIGMWLVDADYVVFLDDDDEFSPDHLALLLDAARSSGTRAAVSGTTTYFDEYVAGTMFRRTVARAEDARQLLPRSNDLEVANCIPLGAMLFDTTLIDQLQIFQEHYGVLAEWDFIWRASRVEKFTHTAQRTFIEHGGLQLYGQQLAGALGGYLSMLDALYAAYPPTSLEVLQAREGHRAQLERITAAPPAVFDDYNKMFALYAALSGFSVQVPA